MPQSLSQLGIIDECTGNCVRILSKNMVLHQAFFGFPIITMFMLLKVNKNSFFLVSGVIPETKKLFAMSFALISTRLDGLEALKSQICRGITFPQGCVKGEVGSRKALFFLFTNKKLIKIQNTFQISPFPPAKPCCETKMAVVELYHFKPEHVPLENKVSNDDSDASESLSSLN